ncbi:MAG: hypothetical protein WBZ36_02015, partial [Candidatus Nitrosopolaris sp.]
ATFGQLPSSRLLCGTPNMAVQKFFEDIERNYDYKLDYDSKLVVCTRDDNEVMANFFIRSPNTNVEFPTCFWKQSFQHVNTV